MRHTNIIYDNKKTKYIIYEDGTVINSKSGHIMKHELSINGYEIVRLSFRKYKRTELFVHRLLAIYFISNPENKEYVHHKDKNKRNNSLENLQWVTQEEHEILHQNDDSHPFGRNENHYNSKLTNQQVHEICKILEDSSMTQIEIAKKYNVPTQIIREIRVGNNWTDISKNYNIKQYHNLEWVAADEKLVRLVCGDIEKGILTKKEIIKKYNITEEFVRRIFYGQSFVNISKEYDFTKNTVFHTRKINDKKINIIKYMIKHDFENKDIISALQLPNTEKMNLLINHYRK